MYHWVCLSHSLCPCLTALVQIVKITQVFVNSLFTGLLTAIYFLFFYLLHYCLSFCETDHITFLFKTSNSFHIQAYLVFMPVFIHAVLVCLEPSFLLPSQGSNLLFFKAYTIFAEACPDSSNSPILFCNSILFIPYCCLEFILSDCSLLTYMHFFFF